MVASNRYFVQTSGSSFWPKLCADLSNSFDLGFAVIDDRLEAEFRNLPCGEIILGNDLKFGLFDRTKCEPFPTELRNKFHFRKREKEAIYSLDRSNVGGHLPLQERLLLISTFADYFWHLFKVHEPSFGLATESPHTLGDILLHGVAESLAIPILHFQQNPVMPSVRPVLGPYYDRVETTNALGDAGEADRVARLKPFRSSVEAFVTQACEPGLARHESALHARDRSTFSGPKSGWRRFYVPFDWLSGEQRQYKIYASRVRKDFRSLPLPIHQETVGHGPIAIALRSLGLSWQQRRQLTKLREALMSVSDSHLPPAHGTFFLQFEPEKSSMPDGGMFSDQLAAARSIASALQGKMPLVVREHPSQLTLIARGFRVRTPRFYDELSRIPNVIIASPEIPREAILQRTKVAITLQGSIGLEARARGLPVIALGHPWYVPLSGVFSPERFNNIEEMITASLEWCPSVPDEVADELWSLIESDSIVVLLNPSAAGLFPNVENDVETLSRLVRFHFASKA